MSMSSDNNSDNKEDDGETKEENKQEKLKVTVVDVDNVPDIVDNLIHNEEEQDVHLQNGEQVDDPEEPDHDDMEMAEPADELQMILDQLIQGNLGPIFQEMAQMNELEDPPDDLDDRLFEEENDDQGPPPMEPEDIANTATIMVENGGQGQKWAFKVVQNC